MTLGDLVKEYREQHNISMDEFSKICNLSKGYISMLENNTNPRSNKPIAPTLPTIKKIALAMNADVDSVLKLLDSDQGISLESEEPIFCKSEDALGEIEIRIKGIIIERYGSLKKFCEKIGMPWTTLDSILKRGIVNSNITNFMKITKELKIDTESLVSGVIEKSSEKNIFSGTKECEPKIIQYYEMLNDIGKHEATKRVEELTYIPQYTKETNEDYLEVNAASPDKNSTSEERIAGDTIMTDDSEWE